LAVLHGQLQQVLEHLDEAAEGGRTAVRRGHCDCLEVEKDRR
jgi:hypothetical protein